MTRAFLDYARDVQTGALVPAKIDPGILREVPLRDPRVRIDDFLAADPATYLRQLPPQSAEYAQLMREKLVLEDRIALGGWGPVVAAESLAPGASGPQVVALRDRLVQMLVREERLNLALRSFACIPVIAELDRGRFGAVFEHRS